MIVTRYEIYSKRTKHRVPFTKVVSSNEVADLVRHLIGDSMAVRERVYMLMFNQGNKLIGYSLLGVGGVSSCVADIRILCKTALDSLTSAVVLIHNHPSGSLKPSNADSHLTQRAKDALRTADIELMDHVIVTEDNHYSYADNGKL